MAKRTGLGKGLGAIFGEDVVENQPNNGSENVSRETLEKTEIHTQEKEK